MKRVLLSLCWTLAFAGVLVLTPSRLIAASAVPGFSENQVKAAFITHLFSFIEWPTETGHYVLCVTKASSLVDTISELIAAKPALGLSVRLLAQSEVSRETCHAVILNTDTSHGLEINNPSVVDMAQIGLLTIGDTPGFAKRGGMIELERRPSRIGLVVNLTAAQKAGFQVSSKLLRLATIVDRGGA